MTPEERAEDILKQYDSMYLDNTFNLILGHIKQAEKEAYEKGVKDGKMLVMTSGMND